MIIKKNLTEQNKLDILESYNRGLNMEEVTIRKVLFYRFTEEQEKELINFYLKEGENKITTRNKFNCNYATVGRILEKYGVEQKTLSHIKQTYTLNEQYFDKIDTEEKAYFLGLLCADGCNCIKKKVVTISLIEEDKAILDKLNFALQCYKFLNWIYEDCTIYLDRKYNFYKEFKQFLVQRTKEKKCNGMFKLYEE